MRFTRGRGTKISPEENHSKIRKRQIISLLIPGIKRCLEKAVHLKRRRIFRIARYSSTRQGFQRSQITAGLLPWHSFLRQGGAGVKV